MSVSNVMVLAPNGRRQTVKCTPNTTIMQILEEVCRKQGFKSEDYDIKHHNKVIDTSLAFRFSGLPNNAQLELTTATKIRVDSEVVLAVNLEDGTRIVGNFQPDETLYNVVSQLCPNELQSQHNLVIIYMRNEIFEENLQKTSLRSLGLRGGRAMLRLVHKTPEELKMQANVSAPLPAKLAEEKPYHRALKTEQVSSKHEDEREAKTLQKKNELDLLKLAKEREKRKFESPTKLDVEVTSRKTKPKVEEIKDEAMEIDADDEPKGEPSDIEALQDSNIEKDFVFLEERHAMLFSLDSAQSLPAEDLPDDFFELTIDDAKRILNDIRRRRSEMENATLMTAAMRNLEESKKQLRQLNKYKQSVIRVQFPDRTILQGCFKPSETVQDVKDFVRNYLQEASVDFYLYTTPPKAVLGEQETLLETGCVPGALLHLGTTDSSGICLKNELRDKFTTNSVASMAASRLRERGRRLVESSVEQIDGDESVDNVDVPGPSSQPTNYERKVFKSTEKVPKWFKPFK